MSTTSKSAFGFIFTLALMAIYLTICFLGILIEDIPYSSNFAGYGLLLFLIPCICIFVHFAAQNQTKESKFYAPNYASATNAYFILFYVGLNYLISIVLSALIIINFEGLEAFKATRIYVFLVLNVLILLMATKTFHDQLIKDKSFDPPILWRFFNDKIYFLSRYFRPKCQQ